MTEPEVPLLLDTHAAIWVSNDIPIAEGAKEAINQAHAGGLPVYISPIAAWEIGMLVAHGRLSLSSRPELWFDRLLEVSGVYLATLSPAILILSSFLPGMPPRDPADRIIAATAREGGFRLVTRDRGLLSYAEEGHIQAVPC